MGKLNQSPEKCRVRLPAQLPGVGSCCLEHQGKKMLEGGVEGECSPTVLHPSEP